MRGEQLPLTDALGEPIAYEDMTRAQQARQQSNDAMVALVRRTQPQAMYWWRVADLDGAERAVCRLCDKPIEIGELGLGFTAEQLNLIDAHKITHWRDLLPNGGRR